MKNFVEIPGGKLKQVKGRFGGDTKNHHDNDDDDIPPPNRRSRQDRHAQKLKLRVAMARGDFELPEELL